MVRYLQIVLFSLLFVVPLSASAGNCAKCGVVAPTGWKLCQRCKNEQEKLERAEARKKRKAEEDEARFLTADGIVGRTVTIRLARDLDTALDNRYDDNSDSLMMEMDRVFDLWIVATDNIELLRERHAKEASDLDAL